MKMENILGDLEYENEISKLSVSYIYLDYL